MPGRKSRRPKKGRSRKTSRASRKTTLPAPQRASSSRDTVDGLKVCYIGGGSTGWAHILMSDLAVCKQLGGEVRLYDVVHDHARLNARYGNKLFKLKQAKSKWTWRAVEKLGDALEGADFVFLSITPGQLESFAEEMDIAARHGIVMPVGDTVGPTGLMRGLRSARIYAGLARAIAEVAPDAWVINYTNPMTICTRTLYRVFPDIKAFGCCHEVFGTQRLLGNLVQTYWDEKKVDRDEIEVDVTGINHFTWVTRATWRGRDLRPLWDREFEENPALKPRYTYDDVKDEYFMGKNCVKFALADRYGPMAAAGDRHLMEFVPGFTTSADEVYRWGVNLTPVREFRIKRRGERIAENKARVAGKQPIKISRSREEGVRQMMAILGLGDLTTNVNLPNRGQVAGLPMDAVVETNALFGRDRVVPLATGALPESLHGLITQHVSNQEAIVEAALEQDEDRVIAAIHNDPATPLPLDQTATMVREMIKATRPWSFSMTPPK